jgi:hypothetical protein
MMLSTKAQMDTACEARNKEERKAMKATPAAMRWRIRIVRRPVRIRETREEERPIREEIEGGIV